MQTVRVNSMIIRTIILVITGVAAGATIASGVFAFINKIGIIPRLAGRTNTASYIKIYEDAIICGGIVGNIMSFFDIRIPAGLIGQLVLGLSSGVYAGCLAMAIAETLDVIPTFFHKLKLKFGLAALILSIAIGKCVGTFYQLFFKH